MIFYGFECVFLLTCISYSHMIYFFSQTAHAQDRSQAVLWCQNNLGHRFIFGVSKTHRRSPITPTPPNNRFVTVSLPPYFVLSRQCAIILALVRHLVIVIVLSCHFFIDSKVDYTTVNYVDLSKIYIFDGFTWSAWSDYNHFF